MPSVTLPSYSPENPPFFVPFRPKGDRVIGREVALQAVRKQLLSVRRTAIGQTASFQGLGGLGKTQLAVEYAWKYRDQYPNGVVWLNADQDIDAQLTRLAVDARWVASESEHRLKLDIALHRLRSYSDCLIIFDNLENVAAIQPYLPDPGANPHLLATSRIEQPSFVAVELPLLDLQQSLELLNQEAARTPAQPDEEAAAKAVASQLAGLPLALEMAGAYLLHRNSLSWNQYRQMLESNLRAALRPELLSSFTRHEQDLFATLKIQAEALEEEPLLLEILDLLTWSGAVSMGLSLMSTALEVPEVDLLGPLALGAKLRLLEREAEKDRYGIHRLVSRVRRENSPFTLRKHWAELICRRLGDWFESRRQNFADLPTFEIEIDHLKAWQAHASEQVNSQESRLIWLQAYPAFHRGRYKEAHAQIFRAMACLSQEEGGNRRLEAWLWNDLGAIEGKLGDISSSMGSHLKALEIRQQALGEDHPDTVLSQQNITSNYLNAGNYTKALEIASRTLDQCKRTLGENHPSTVRSLEQVGNAYCNLGDYNRSLDYHVQGLKIRERMLDRHHPETARSLDHVGIDYGYLKNHARSLDFHLQSLEIRKLRLGEHHPDTALSFDHLGSSYRDLGDYRKALELHLKASAIIRETLGEQHFQTAEIISNLASAYGRLGEAAKNLELQLQALEIRQHALGNDHPHTCQSLRLVGVAHYLLGNSEEALRFLRESFDIRRKVLNEQHPETAKVLNELISILINQGKRSEAFELLEPYLQRLPKDHPSAAGLRTLRTQLLSKPIRAGFRQPSSKPNSRGKKRKR